MTVASTDWSLSMASGGKPVFLRNSSASASIFSQDGRYSIVVLSHQVRVYFISTRQCIRTIDIDLSDLVDIKLDILNPNQVLLFKEAEVITLNWKEKMNQPIISSQTIGADFPILSVIAMDRDSFYIMCGKKDKKSAGSPHTRFIYKIVRDQLVPYKLFEVGNIVRYSVSSDNSKIALLTASHEVVLVDLSNVYKSSGKVEDDELGDENEANQQTDFNPDLIDLSQEIIAFPYKSPVTALAVSNDSIIAIGTSAGAIQILYGGLLTEKPQRLLKWHIDQVRSLQFTHDNNYLLSGGLEKVLVFWQLETEKTQFLPRLNGTIDKISIDNNKNDYYTLMLKISSSNSNILDDNEDNFEVLVISAVDLISRLSINSIRPKFASNVQPTLLKAKKKYLKSELSFDKTKLKHDYSSIFEVHPKTKNLYVPNDATIQAYDLIKNEQTFIQNAAPLLSTGKVRSENKLLDPTISLISFTQDGEWMCTFDSISTSEVDNLLSKDDKQYALKFWKFIESNPSASNSTKNETTNSINNKTGYWELSTKVIDPHGSSNLILSLTPAPLSYYKGLAFLTADNKGGLRIWRPRVPKEIYQMIKSSNNKLQQTAWTLRKSRPCGASTSDAVDTCWSEDGSVIILGHECSIITINTSTFEEISNNLFKIPSLSGSRIRSLSILDNNLIVLSKTRIASFNLLNGEMNELVAKVNTTIGSKNLITIDPINRLICLAINYYNTENDEFKINSKILLFKPNQLEPVFIRYYNQGISSIRYFNSSFLFIDLDSRIGIIHPSSSSSSILESEDNFDLTNDMNNMLMNAQATADIINNRQVSIKTKRQQADSDEFDESLEFNRVIDINTFQPIFENLEGIQLDTLFDRIIKVIR